MAYTPKDNSGTLFRNDRKEKDTHPDYNGTAVIDGVEYWMNAWLKEGQRGKYFSFSFRPKDTERAYRDAAQPVRPAAPAGADLDDEIPF